MTPVLLSSDSTVPHSRLSLPEDAENANISEEPETTPAIEPPSIFTPPKIKVTGCYGRSENTRPTGVQSQGSQVIDPTLAFIVYPLPPLPTPPPPFSPTPDSHKKYADLATVFVQSESLKKVLKRYLPEWIDLHVYPTVCVNVRTILIFQGWRAPLICLVTCAKERTGQITGCTS